MLQKAGGHSIPHVAAAGDEGVDESTESLDCPGCRLGKVSGAYGGQFHEDCVEVELADTAVTLAFIPFVSKSRKQFDEGGDKILWSLYLHLIHKGTSQPRRGFLAVVLEALVVPS